MFNTRLAFVIACFVVQLDAQSIGQWYTQHKTMQAYQNQDIAQAQESYAGIVKEQPHDPRVNFNEGCLLYKQADYPGASASFERAAQQQESLTQEEQQELYFNLGNSYAYQKQWQAAIDAYDKVLALEPTHERALHNKEIVQKLRDQEKQQQQQDQQKENENKQNQQDKKDQDKSEQNNQGQQKDQQQSPEKKEEGSNQREQKGNQDQERDKQQSGDQSNNTNDAANDHKEKGSDQMEQEKEAQEQKGKENKEHDKKPPQNSSQDKATSGGQQEQEADTPVDPAEQLLAKIEKQDTKEAKRLMQMMVAQAKGGQHDHTPSW